MRLETFFEKFDELADTPAGVKSMREIVLRLAFSGGLAGKRPTEDGVPEGWESRTIESISASISSGFACSRSHQVENGHVHLRTHNISTLGTLNFDLLVRIDPKMVDPQKASIRAGDILFNNTNSQELVGKTSLVDRDYNYGFSNHITRIRLKDGIFPGFVVFYLTLLRNSGYFARLCTRWINQAAVNTDTLKEQTIPLPPLVDQKRIVAKVDELMALCDRLEAQQQERETRHAALARASLARFADAPTPANLPFLFHPSYAIPPADLRKSILTFAVQGKLVPQDPNDEPAEELLQKITAAQERLVKAREIRRIETGPLAEEDEPFAIPSNWAWTRLGQIGDWGSGSTPPRGNHELYGGSVPWLKSGELNDNRALAGSEETVTELAMKTCSFRPNKPGDVLLAMYGATIGKAAILAEAAVTNQAVCGCTPFPGVLNTYLFDYLVSQRDAFHAASEGGAQPNISKVKIVGYPFPLPPLAEQRRIVAKVEQLMALVDALETQIITSRTTGVNLLEAVVSELTMGV
jgi:type I restriction enzyme S subunit